MTNNEKHLEKSEAQKPSDNGVHGAQIINIEGSKLKQRQESLDASKAFQAIGEFTKALETDKNNSEAIVARGACFALLNKLDKAMQDELRAIDLLKGSNDKSRLSQAYSNKAAIELKQAKHELARNDAKHALNLDGANAAAQSILNDLTLKSRK